MRPNVAGTRPEPAAGVPEPVPAVAPVVQVRGLVRTFRRGRRTMLERLRRTPDRRERVAAVNGIDLDICPGEIFGLLGPNGAGKTTTVRMLATLVRPTAGSITLCGVDGVADPQAARSLLGAVLGGERSVYWKLTARENLQYFAALYQVPAAATAARIDELLAGVGLHDRADDYVERYSTGMRQRLALARALLVDPPLLLLDEPTSGLDPQASSDLRDRVRELGSRGKTVMITTHDMDEADRLCDRVAIIDHGRIVALDSPSALKRALRATQAVDLQVTVSAWAEAELRAGFAWFARVAGVWRTGDTARYSLHGEVEGDLVPLAVEAARRCGATVHRVDVVPVTLEDVFLALTGRELRE
jgi:ABC-2 type transport system ATP-binding protein